MTADIKSAVFYISGNQKYIIHRSIGIVYLKQRSCFLEANQLGLEYEINKGGRNMDDLRRMYEEGSTDNDNGKDSRKEVYAA